MNKIFIFFIFTFFGFPASYAQDNPCNMTWGAWEPTPVGGSGGVFYSVQSSVCLPTGICGFPKIGLQHTFPYPVSISLRLRGFDCSGKPGTGTYTTGTKKITANEAYRSSSNWHTFKTVTEVLRVEVNYSDGQDSYRILYDKELGIDEIYINGKTRAALQIEANKVAEEEKRKEQAAKDQAAKEQADKEQATKEKTAREKAAGRSASLTDGKEKSDTTKAKSSSGSGKTSYTPPPETEHDREMRERASAQNAKDKNEDKTMGAIMGGAAAGIAGVMALNLDNGNEDEELPFYLKGNIGLGLQQIPISQNQVFNGSKHLSSPTSTNHFSVHAFLLASAFNNKIVRCSVSPFFSYGMNAFEAGTSGNHTSYGSTVSVGIGSGLRFLINGQYARRTGNMTSDNAVAGQDIKGSTDYRYSTFKYGIGAYYGFGAHDCFVEINAYKEQLSFLKNVSGGVYSYELTLSFGLLALTAQYAPNYPIAGQVLYPATYQKEKQSLFTFMLSAPLTIFKVE